MVNRGILEGDRVTRHIQQNHFMLINYVHDKTKVGGMLEVTASVDG